MIFNTRMNRPCVVPVPHGDGTAPVYEEVFKNGEYSLEITGKDDLNAFVQASKEESLVYNIIERYQRGDVNALNARIGQYMDVVGMPTNLAEAHKIMLDAERKFNGLAPDVRAKFDNDVNVFVDVVSHATPDKLKEYFAVPATTDVKDGDDNVA